LQKFQAASCVIQRQPENSLNQGLKHGRLFIEWILRLIFWLERKLGWIKHPTPKPTRKQTVIDTMVVLAILVLGGRLA